MLGDNLMVIINTKYGSFEGLTHKNLDLFLGIPYAYLLDIVVLNTLVLSIVMIHWLMLQFRAIPPQPFNKLETFFQLRNRNFNLMKIAYI